jgi:hypothetical protein
VFGYRTCPECGVAVQAASLSAGSHECAHERFVAHQVLKARHGIDRLERDMESWLDTPEGRFAAFYARRTVR